MTDLYDDITTGQIAKIKGRKAVYLYYASYAGGSGPLWAIEGMAVQFTLQDCFWLYQSAICRKVTAETVVLQLESGELLEVPVGDIGRFDQFHLPCGQRFEFSDHEIELITERPAAKTESKEDDT